ncbi:WD repeat-containing protein 36-like isoform X2 [Dysidea avara]|uniref:WD repeat-containing protein 36-like isoform X2 n=1 Tax=Dysidea avara TaxID=196820 RepID=UPI0033284B26
MSILYTDKLSCFCKLIYTFKGWSSAVVSLAQSPAVDITGIGLESGKLVIHNLRTDETLMSFHQDWGLVTAVSFRTDGVTTVATASSVGHIAVWGLDERRLVTVVRDAHDGIIGGMEFIQSQPLMVTSGNDNSIKVWIFDQSDGSARLLRSRCGHSAPPTMIRFPTVGGHAILSAGTDRSLRLFSLVKDSTSCELSQGSLVKKAKNYGVSVTNLKLPPITSFAVEPNRAADWDSVVTIHDNSSDDSLAMTPAHTWHLFRHKIGNHKLTSKFASSGARPQCACVTACGNFAIVGMTTGHMEMFNMQSGLHRGVFGKGKAHSKAVRSVVVDSTNSEVFSVSSDSSIKVWSFRTRKYVDSIELDCPVSSLLYHRHSCLLAAACDNFTLHIIDTDTRRIIRTFAGHTNRITDMAFSPDAHWLISTSMDCTIRSWDLPSARMIDCFLVESPATSVTMSPNSIYLATTHADEFGIYLWSNQTLYSQVSLKPLPKDYNPFTLPLPHTGSPDQTATEDIITDHQDTEEEEDTDQYTGPVGDGLVTLSQLPKSRWHTLAHIDVIKERNKPKEPPKAPKAAPFFLPTQPGLQLKFVDPKTDEELKLEAGSSKLVHLAKLQTMTDFQVCLKECLQKNEFSEAFDQLKSMGPSAIDVELRSLGPEGGGSEEMLHHMMQLLLSQLKTGKDFELVQAYMSLFLKIYASHIAESSELVKLAEELLSEQQHVWGRIQQQLDKNSCLIGYLRSATI